MRKLLASLTLFCAVFTASAQNINFGVKAGAIFNVDKGKNVFKTAEDAFSNKGKGSTGFQGGVFMRASVLGIYIQPELLYTNYKNKYNTEEGSFKVTKQRIDIPVSIGKKILGIAHIQAGPVFSYYLKDDISMKGISGKKQDDFSVGLQIGTGVTISKLVLDLRYELGFGKISSSFIEGGSSFDTRSTPKLLHLSVGYLF